MRSEFALMRNRTLAEVLKSVSAPLECADLGLVATALVNKLEPLRREQLARRHKLVEGAASEVTHPQVQQAISRMLRQAGEIALSKLLIEAVLLEAADQPKKGEADILITAAKRHPLDVEKVWKAVEQEFTAKRARLAAKQSRKDKERRHETRRLILTLSTVAFGKWPSAGVSFQDYFSAFHIQTAGCR